MFADVFDRLVWLEPVLPLAIPAFILAWFFCLGGAIGSFLNVVIYRVPAGLNLFYPPSRCPVCEHRIRLTDNVPILGWIRLGGRCRDCGTSISPRYPIVEAILAVTFLVVAGTEIAADRPFAALDLPKGTLPLPAVWIGTLLHLGWLATAFSVGMIRRDGERAPSQIWLPILLASIAAILWEPRIQALPPLPIDLFDEDALHLGALSVIPGIVACTLGGFVGVAFAMLAAFPSDGRRDRPVSFGAATLGILCGWQAAGLLIVLALAAQIAISMLARAIDAKRPLGQTLAWYGAVAASLTVLPWLEDGLRRLGGMPDGIVAVSLIASLLVGRTVLHFLEASPEPNQRTRIVQDPHGAPTVPSDDEAPLSTESDRKSSFMEDRSRREAEDKHYLADAVGRDGIDLPEEPTSHRPDAEPGFSDGSYPQDAVAESSMTPEEQANLAAILASPSYRVAYKDVDFLHREGLRPVRLQLELLKVEVALTEEGIHSTIVVFGGTQVVERADAEKRLALAKSAIEKDPDDFLAQRELTKAERILAKSHFYDEARKFGRLASAGSQDRPSKDYVVITGGGPGVMEAANRGAMDVGAKSIGLNIALPEEQHPNPYITPELCFQFHYFALRKMHFLLRAKALVVFPGGYGTLDEMFEVLTLRQTGRMQPIPIILVGREYWENVIDFQYLADEGVIRDAHLELMEFVETADEAWKIIQEFHSAAKS